MVEAPLVILDDDPTGTQAVADVPVLLRWTAETIRLAAINGAASVHISTNSRAMAPEQARAAVTTASMAARQAFPQASVVLRGDSTLRAHLLEEYLGVVEGAYEGLPPLLLVPALPAAGRVTRGGLHCLRRGDALVPLHETEYAGDGVFAYRDALLLQWAEDRSRGFFPRARGREVHLADLRARGPATVKEALLELSSSGSGSGSGRPSVCAPDAETMADLAIIAEGWRAAQEVGCQVVVRCAPAFAGVAAGTIATAPVRVPATADGALVVCGSYVPLSTRQLGKLTDKHPHALVEVDAVALAGTDPEPEVERAIRRVTASLAERQLAVLATPRQRPSGTDNLDAGERIAGNLARIVAGLAHLPSVVIAKGGITSAVIARDGFGADRADVIGPVVAGVAMWRISTVHRAEPVALLIVPGNVGEDRLLVDLVDRVLDPSRRTPC